MVSRASNCSRSSAASRRSSRSAAVVLALSKRINAATAITRQQHADLFLSAIVEGPHDWPVRPVAEVAYERDFGRVETKTALVGAIWQVRVDLAVDIGLRGGRINNRPLV